jgi:lysophospholipase L1-like esterase
VYVAIGASDALGFGTPDPVRQAWPQVFFARTLPAGSTFVNLAVAGSTVEAALRQQLPYARDLRPTVVTVFLGVNDLRAGVTAAAFAARLRTLLFDLREDGSPTVLVANVPPLDHLPAYLACRPDPPPGGPPCSTTGAFPAPTQLDDEVTAYDRAVADAATAAGAAVVDLHAAELAARAAGTEAALVSSDGFHPSPTGHALIASAFADAYRRLTAG